MHTLKYLQGNIPSFVAITDGKVHDVNMLDVLIIEEGSYSEHQCIWTSQYYKLVTNSVCTITEVYTYD